jgi:hypothetical protein
LKWSDVDLVTGRLQVKRALQRQRGRGLVFVETKSFRSRRLVCLSNLAIDTRREQRVRSGVSWSSRTNSASRRSRAR